jgi:hypothetical protein
MQEQTSLLLLVVFVIILRFPVPVYTILLDVSFAELQVLPTPQNLTLYKDLPQLQAADSHHVAPLDRHVLEPDRLFADAVRCFGREEEPHLIL